MKQASVLPVLLLMGIPAMAQTPKENSIRYNQLIAQAAMATAKGTPQRAIPLYDMAFTLANWGLYNYFLATETALEAGRADKANEYLLLGVGQGMQPHLYSDSIYDAFLASDDSKLFKDSSELVHTQFAARTDSAVIKRLQQLYARDQQTRDGSPLEAHYDSLNFDALISICEEKGFPVTRTVGSTSGQAWLLLWHHRDTYPATAQWQKVLPFIHAAMDTGDLDPASLCGFDDFAASEEGLPMPYGTLLGYYRNHPEKLYFIDRKRLNANRASVGWAPIEQDAEIFGIDLSGVRFAEP